MSVAGGTFILITLRTPANILPLLGISADAAELASDQAALWKLVSCAQMQGGDTAQQQLLNFYVLTSMSLTAVCPHGSAHGAR